MRSKINIDTTNSVESEFEHRPITGADIQALIINNRILGNEWVLPPASALDQLGKSISLIRGRVRVANRSHLTEAARLSDELKIAATKALEVLIHALPIIRAEYACELERLESTSGPSLLNEMYIQAKQEIAGLENAVNEAFQYTWLMPGEELSIAVGSGMTHLSDAFGVASPSLIKEIYKWHHFVEYLFNKFCDAVASSNPLKKRLTAGGAGGNAAMRFLAAIIPHVSGERPQIDAIRIWLARKTREEQTVIRRVPRNN